MFPSFNLFGMPISMYAVCILIGLTFGILLAVFWTDRVGLKRDDVFYSCLFAVIGLIVGSKVLYWITIIPFLIEHPEIFSTQAGWLALFQGGFVFYGGLIGALLMVWWYARSYKIPVLALFDRLVPSVPLAHLFGRLGCFCAGCCYGLPSSFGVEFNASEVAPHGVKLFPIQLVEAACNLLLFGLLLLLRRFCRRQGMPTGIYLAGYAVIRFVLEFFRYDAERGGFWGLSTSQWISLALLPAAVLILRFGGARKNEEAEQDG